MTGQQPIAGRMNPTQEVIVTGLWSWDSGRMIEQHLAWRGSRLMAFSGSTVYGLEWDMEGGVQSQAVAHIKLH